MIEFSFFKSRFDNVPQRAVEQSYNDFINKMEMISSYPNYKPSMGEYMQGAPLLSPAIYDYNNPKVRNDDGQPTRCNDNVVGWDMMIADIDEHVQSLEQLTKHFNGFDYTLYSSPSCTHDALRLRVIIPLTHRCPSAHLSQLWHGFNTWCNGIVDKQTKDKSRMFYIPAKYTNKGNDYRHFFIRKLGASLNWEKLIECYPSPQEKELFKVSNPYHELERAVWSKTKAIPSFNILSKDCPFCDERIINEYRLTPQGSHHGAIYKAAIKMAGKAKDYGYPLSIEELAEMLKSLDDLDGDFYNMKKMLNDAKDALSYLGMI